MPWYRDPQFLPAAFGLFGVIIGGLVTGVSTYLLERSKEKRSRQHELKKAARLILANLTLLRADVQGAIENAAWPEDSLANYSPGAWLEYQNVLAGGLPDEAWDNLVLAILVADSFTRLHQLASQLPRDQRKLEKEQLENMQLRLETIIASIDHLANFLGRSRLAI
jgi:hypothetical protein